MCQLKCRVLESVFLNVCCRNEIVSGCLILRSGAILIAVNSVGGDEFPVCRAVSQTFCESCEVCYFYFEYIQFCWEHKTVVSLL